MKILTIVGARPQFIKAASLSRNLRLFHKEVLLHTGQHYSENMSDVFFEELSIPKPDYNLHIGSGTHGEQTGKMLQAIEQVLFTEKPNAVIIFGDTNSTLAGALAAAKMHIPIYHVESGLRSFNKAMPEEQNRLLSDHLSTLLFCPTETAVSNLKNEGLEKGVFNVGDIMYETILNYIKIANEKYTLNTDNKSFLLPNSNYIITKKNYYLATVHRAENTDTYDKLDTILRAFEKLNYPVIFPLHPRTKKIIEDCNIKLSNTIIIEPIGYLLMLFLISNAKMVITDSGGLQKESFILRTPCTTLRNETEWKETLTNNWNMLTKINETDIIEAVNRKTIKEYPANNPFGNGDTSIKIINIINNLNNDEKE